MAKKDLTVTEIGTFVYPHLTRADTKFEKEGVYHVKVNLPASEKTEAIKTAIVDGAAKALEDAKEANKGKKPEKGKKPPKLALCDDMPFIEEEDGTITFNFKMKASGKDKDGKPFTMKPSLYDAKGTPITKAIRIGGGTRGKVSFSLDPFYAPQLGAGVTLRLYGVQIIQLVEFSTRDAASLGFGAEEGFSVEDATESSEFDETEGTESESGTDSEAGSESDDF